MQAPFKLFFVGLIVTVLGMSVAAAEDSENKTPAGTPEKRHNISLFGGGHHAIDEGSDKGVIIGTQYEYRLDRLFGIGGTVEYVGGEFSKWIFTLPLYIHPYGGWEFRVAPGVEIESDESFLSGNLGVSYEFELNEQWVLQPDAEITFTKEDTFLSYGLSLTFKF